MVEAASTGNIAAPVGGGVMGEVVKGPARDATAPVGGRVASEPVRDTRAPAGGRVVVGDPWLE